MSVLRSAKLRKLLPSGRAGVIIWMGRGVVVYLCKKSLHNCGNSKDDNFSFAVLATSESCSCHRFQRHVLQLVEFFSSVDHHVANLAFTTHYQCFAGEIIAYMVMIISAGQRRDRSINAHLICYFGGYTTPSTTGMTLAVGSLSYGSKVRLHCGSVSKCSQSSP